MNGKKLLISVGSVDGRFIEETGAALQGEPLQEQKGKLRLRKTLWLMAAVIASILMMGCAVLVHLTPAVAPWDTIPDADLTEIRQEDIAASVLSAEPHRIRVAYQVKGVEDACVYMLVDAPYTLEKQTAGGWELLPQKAEDPQWHTTRMKTEGSAEWDVYFTTLYGMLEPGTYRYTAQVLEGYEPVSVSFTIHDNSKLQQAVQQILNSEYYHVRYTACRAYGKGELSQEEQAALNGEIEQVLDYWKCGEDYLVLEHWNGQLSGGHMLKDGVKYSLNHQEESLDSPIAGWELWPGMTMNRLTEWSSCCAQAEDWNVVYDEKGMLIQLTSSHAEMTTYEAYGQQEYVYSSIVDILPTSREEARQQIDSQTADGNRLFSWEEDQKSCTPLELPFRNTESSPVANAADAAKLAEKECTRDANRVLVYRDEAAGMWKVEFQFEYGHQGYLYVYLNDSGVTQLLAEGAPKWENAEAREDGT